MKKTSPNTCCATTSPTYVPFFAIVSLTLAVVMFIAASYFMAKETLLETLSLIASIQPVINFVLIGLSVVLMSFGKILNWRWMVTWGLRCANCIATLSIAAGVFVVIGSTQGGVDEQVMRGLYFWQPWFIIYYAIFVAAHALVQWCVYSAQSREQ